MEILKITGLVVSALLLLPASASAQELSQVSAGDLIHEPIEVELDPEIPWFKVEIIVFRNLAPMPGENEVFTPRVGPESDVQVDPDGAIDTRMQESGISGTPFDKVQDANSAGMPDGRSGMTPPPEFSDRMDASLDDAGQTDTDPGLAGPPTLEELYFPPGSYFRLVALEELYPDETRSELLETSRGQPGDQSSVTPDQPRKNEAPLTESEAARQALLHEFELDDQARRIHNRKDYELLAHVAWIQPGYAQADAVAFPLAELAGAASGLKGDITLYLSRYLHMQFDLSVSEPGDLPVETQDGEPLFSSPVTAASLEDRDPAAAPVFRINEKRRMRSDELHYIDHPNFGALVRVSKVDPSDLVEPNL